MDKNKILEAMAGQKILVAGDIMLDTFVYGDVDRISPEGPVPVLSVTHQKIMLGGAGNVISNLHALGCHPVPFCVVGYDDGASKILDTLKELNVRTDGVFTDSARPTILKTRYVSRSQQLLRCDVENTQPILASLETKIIDGINVAMKDCAAIVLSDYGKGFLTKVIIRSVITAGKAQNIPVLVDPKGHDYSIYRGANIITPNRKEIVQATGMTIVKTDQDIENASLKIIDECGIDCVIATRSEDGLSVIQKGKMPLHIPTHAQEVYDVSGAGDTVIATMAATLAGGADIESAANIANIAGGLAVSKLGTTSVTYQELESSIFGNFRQAGVVSTWEDAKTIINDWKKQGQKVGLTNGCFDILHAGHVRYIDQARAKCDRLIVALNSDVSVRILKGPTRPVNDQDARATVMSGLGSVDMVVFFGAEKAGEDNTPCALVDALRPDIFFKGGDYTIDQLPEGKIVQSYGGEVAIMAMHEGFSTTAIIKKSSGIA